MSIHQLSALICLVVVLVGKCQLLPLGILCWSLVFKHVQCLHPYAPAVLPRLVRFVLVNVPAAALFPGLYHSQSPRKKKDRECKPRLYASSSAALQYPSLPLPPSLSTTPFNHACPESVLQRVCHMISTVTIFRIYHCPLNFLASTLWGGADGLTVPSQPYLDHKKMRKRLASTPSHSQSRGSQDAIHGPPKICNPYNDQLSSPTIKSVLYTTMLSSDLPSSPQHI